MNDDGDLLRIRDDAFPRPGRAARMRFFVRRYPIAILLIVGVLAGSGAALLGALAIGVWKIGNARLFVALTAPGFACFVIAFVPMFLARRRLAEGEDIAVALAAATAHERSHLLVAIEGRLSSRLRSEPMTTIELVLAFKDVRERHGDRARRRRLFEERGRIEQERFVSRLAGIPPS